VCSRGSWIASAPASLHHLAQSVFTKDLAALRARVTDGELIVTSIVSVGHVCHRPIELNLPPLQWRLFGLVPDTVVIIVVPFVAVDFRAGLVVAEVVRTIRTILYIYGDCVSVWIERKSLKPL